MVLLQRANLEIEAVHDGRSVQVEEFLHDGAHELLGEDLGSVSHDSLGQVGRVRMPLRRVKYVAGSNHLLTSRGTARVGGGGQVRGRAIAVRDAVVRVGGHAIGQGAREQLVQGGAVAEAGREEDQEVVVDAEGRHLLHASGQAVVEERNDLVLEQAGAEPRGKEVQAEEFLAAHVAKLHLEVGDTGAGAAVAVDLGVGPLEEALEGLGVLVGEGHGTQLDLRVLLWVFEKKRVLNIVNQLRYFPSFKRADRVHMYHPMWNFRLMEREREAEETYIAKNATEEVAHPHENHPVDVKLGLGLTDHDLQDSVAIELVTALMKCFHVSVRDRAGRGRKEGRYCRRVGGGRRGIRRIEGLIENSLCSLGEDGSVKDKLRGWNLLLR